MSELVYSKEWLADGQIACYRFVSTGEEAAESWFSEIEKLFSAWERSKPLLLLIDLSQADNLLSSEALRIARVISEIGIDIPGRTALMIDASKPSHSVNALVDYVLAHTRVRRIFGSESQAIAWLLQP